MTDFIPGEAYRLDVKAADNKIIVDSWQNKLRADVVSDNGVIQVDVSTGKLYGPLVGDIEDVDGNLVFNLSAQVLRGDLEGSVYDATGNQKLVDGMSGKIFAPVEGNVIDSLGNIIVDTANRTITANTINGDLYGDVYGNISSDSVIYGTFSGDFNGTAYGEFFGDTTGTHTGEVIGDLTGNVTGNIVGNLNGHLIGANLDTSEGAPDTTNITNLNTTITHHQYSFYGGLEHHIAPADDDLARGPIVMLGATRADTALRAHVHHYNGQEIITLHDPIDPDCDTAPATIRGNFDGNFIYSDGETAQDALTASAQGTVLHPVNGVVTIGGYITNDIDCDVNIFADAITVETSADEDLINVKKHCGTITNKTSVAVNDPLLTIHAQGFNGNGYADAGRIGIVTTGTPDADANYINTEFSVSLPNNSQSSLLSNTNKLTFNNSGVLSVPVFKANGHTFATRDSMTAAAGMIIFNTSSNKFQGFTGTAWVDLH
jgi:hypothetical protein